MSKYTITIVVPNEAESVEDVARLLTFIAGQINEGFTSGVSPSWNLIEDVGTVASKGDQNESEEDTVEDAEEESTDSEEDAE